MQLIRRRTGDHVRRKLGRAPIALSAAVLCAVSAVTAGSASAAVASSTPRAAAASPTSDDWASFHRTANLHGWAANSPVTTATAGNLGVKWATDLYGGSVDSPVVAYNTTLNERVGYVGTLTGDLVAVNMSNGQIIWSVALGSELRGSPLVVNGAVWVATFNSPRIYKVNAATGVVGCSVASARMIQGTPVAATPPGGVPSVYFGSGDTATANGPTIAINQSTCAKEWSFYAYKVISGTWTPLDYAVDKTGEPLILFGTADTDSKVYALDAVTGKLVWYYAVQNPPPHTYDIGAGVVTTAPGVNGFADGMAYVESKYGIMYALNLTTGALVWSADYTHEIDSIGRNISTAALSGKNLVLGDEDGLVDLNAVNGKVIWHDDTPSDVAVDSSPAIAGPGGKQVVAVGDLGGSFDVDSLATGKLLYHYQTAQYITASPAVSGGDILISSADGYLYDFAAGGGNSSTLPTAAVASPGDGAQVANPNGNMAVTGKATDPSGIARVVVAVQEGGPNGQWWDAAAGTWVSGPMGNAATVASPGSTSSTWSFAYPVPSSGGTYEAIAYTESVNGQSSPSAQSSFTVQPSAASPQIQASTRFVPPGAQATVSGSGFGDAETVTIKLAGTKVGTATTTAAGAVPPTVVTVPSSTAFGLTSLTATGQASGKVATAGVTVANKWIEAGYDASHTGYEPNDPSIYDSIAAGSGTYMNLSWAYGTGSAVDGPPAVANTVAWVPNHGGKLTEVDVHSGAPLLTWSLPSGASLDGSPAVDTSHGLVFLSGSNGTLTAINSYTAKVVWSDTVGGAVTAPVFGDGRVYVGSSTGTVEAVSETTGAKAWSTKLAHPVSVAPALDVTGKLVIAGESNGDVQALSMATGKSQWTYAASGAVTTPPAVSGGTVYFGAGDSVYAVSESSGALQWSYLTGGQIASSLALTATSNDGLLVTTGSADKHVYTLKASTGKLLWKNGVSSPVTGVASAFASYVFDTSTGEIGAGRITSGERLWERNTSAGAFTSPVVVDGTIYAGGQDGSLYAYTTDGQPPA